MIIKKRVLFSDAYISEIAHPDCRATLSSFIGLALTSGNSVSWILSHYVSWRTIAGLVPILLLMSMVTLSFFPETPYWLVDTDKLEEAVNSLKYFRGEQYDISEEISEIQLKHLTKNANVKNKLTWTLQRLCSKAFWKPFSCIGIIWTLSVLSGTFVFSNYLYDIMEESGSETPLSTVTMTVGIIRLVLAGFVPFIAQKLEPKASFVFGQVVKALGTLTMATYFYLNHLDPEPYKAFTWIPMVVFITEYVVRSVFLMHVNFTLLGELYPTEIRGLSIGVTKSIVFGFGGLANRFYPEMKTELSLYGVCYLYGSINVVNVIWGYLTIPDNRSKSLTEVEESYETKTEEESMETRLLKQ